ncbi:gamma-glutamyltransferase family protein [Pseudobacter ginsenosidimutans]|jgi:gamma-glutamyltranspeptidase/glutathione hydrolase|uniref:Gamma-glutamyltranspeptidase/glutathione hydrolase n=1 Tax=Pseudobacter ginsenosidimutans TaxID=661488 RepID=A0A4Q7ME86_9BACT|nr:gamma-glutamyltransferase [Pseudobacter ginsenosidimutans]QEC42797.1 gamma-glutamyltransferase family protein [Pseudobacter ginsenosidimutans]RZS65042.1 gamma-glutamyltranspeptidase/glutathione hydrolase [Pseudobacter ginsenosidimutans]
MKHLLLTGCLLAAVLTVAAQQTQKPPLHGKHWMAITGKPLAATAGSMIFQKGGNAIDAACAMLAATCTMWDVLSWGGETQALIYNPKTKKVIGINALGVAPTGATAAHFKSQGLDFPPEFGPQAAVTPGTPAGLCHMLAEYGTMSLKQILAPAMELAAGYPIEAQTANSIERGKARIKEWPYSKAVFLTHPGEKREAPEAGEIFVQKDLLETLKKMVQAEEEALKQKKSRKEAIYAAATRFYKGDIAKEFVRGCQEQGGLITMQDLANYKIYEEEPMHTNYKGIDVYKLSQWTQGPMMLQALNILENFDLKKMGYNSAEYIHTVYQAMNLSFADRDFYYGDPYFPPEEPMKGLLSKAYARQRAGLISADKNDAMAGPGDPYPFEGKSNPYLELLKKRGLLIDTTKRSNPQFMPSHDVRNSSAYIHNSELEDSLYHDRLWRGTTSVEAADESGWVVSITPSGGWIPACIAGKTGVGMSQRMQSFVTNPELNPFNVVEPGKRPRVTLTPSLALKNGKPYLSFAVQGGDTQDQNLLQFFLNMVEFGMTVQQATEAANINSNQLWLSLGGTKEKDRQPRAGHLLLKNTTPEPVRNVLKQMGYTLSFDDRTSGPINAIWFDWEHGSFWGGSSNHGEDYGIGW